LNSPTRSQSTYPSLGAGNSVVAGAALGTDAESALEVVDDVRPTAGGYPGYAHTDNRWAHRMVSIHSSTQARWPPVRQTQSENRVC